MNSKTLILAAAAGLALAACGDFERGKPIPVAAGPSDEAPDDNTTPTDGNPVTGPTGPGGGEGLSFAADVHPLLIDKCSQCHGANNSTAYKLTGEAEADLATVLTFVNTGAPADSTLLKKGSGQTSHGGGAVIEVDSAEFETIVQWLTEGAKP